KDMMTMRVFTVLLLVLLVLVVAGPAVAGPLDMPGASQALVCSACHGFAGESRSNTMPILAGIAPWYFKKAIQDYAAGKRTSPEMEPYAKMVLQSGVDDIAAYFAAQARTASPVKLDPAAVERGRSAVRAAGRRGAGAPPAEARLSLATRDGPACHHPRRHWVPRRLLRRVPGNRRRARHVPVAPLRAPATRSRPARGTGRRRHH